MRPVSLSLVAACIWLSGCSDSAELTPIRDHSRTVLAVQQKQQEPMLCVPTSAAMVMAFYGDPHTPREIKALSAGKTYDPKVPFSDYTITRYDDAVRAVSLLGYTWEQRTFPDDDQGFKDGLDLIEDQLRMGHPVMVDATLPTGHTFVLRGFDSNTKELFAVDPDQPSPGEESISFGEFKGLWNEHAYGDDFRAMILTQPKFS